MADYEDNESTTVETRRRRSIWPLILLLLLLLLGLLFFFMNQDSDETNNQQRSPQSSQQSDNESSQAASITTLDDLLNPASQDEVVGQTVNIPDAPVYTVIGDKSFTIGTSNDYAYVLLSEQLDNGSSEQNVQVKAGEKRDIRGTVKAVPADTQTIATEFQLSQAQIDELKTQGYYVEVTNTERP
jgi:hypothetical protein